MNKKIKVLIIIGIVILILLIASITTILIIKNNIKKEKESYLSATNKISDIIEKNCNLEKESEESLVTYKYLIQDGKIDKELDINELIPDNGIIEVNDECKVTLSFIYGDYSIIKKEDKKAKIIEDNYFENGSVVYYNPVDKNVCSDYVAENSLDGNVTGCLKWYVYNDKNSNNTITLLLDHNIVNNIRWITSSDFKANNQTEEEYNNKLGPITLINKLKEMTIDWKDEARLISAEEIAKVIGVDKFDAGNSESYFFDSKLSEPNKKCYKDDITGCNFRWLYDNTSDKCASYGCLNNSLSSDIYGFWTSTPNSQDLTRSWRVYFDGRIISTSINDVSNGIRPVVEIQKSIVK